MFVYKLILVKKCIFPSYSIKPNRRLASIPSGENTCSVLLKMAQKSCHSTAKTLLFMIIQCFRSYTPSNYAQIHGKVGLAFFHTPCITAIVV